MTFLLRARPVFPGRKPTQGDRIRSLAYTSERAWLAEPGADGEALRAPERSPEAASGHLPVVSAGVYPRADGEARIVVIGDSDFASNAYRAAHAPSTSPSGG